MPTLSDALGPPRHTDTGDLSSLPAAHEATITAVGAGTVDVMVPGYSERHDFAGLPYLAPAGKPQTGDACFAIFSDDRDPLILVPGTPAPASRTYTATNVTADRAYDANATSLDEIADVLGTLISDLRERGVVL